MLGAVEWSRGIEDAWSDTVTFVPAFLGFLLILVVGVVVAKLCAAAAERVLERSGFDRAVERGGVGRLLASSRYDAGDIVTGVVFWGLVLVVLQLAFGIFGDNPVSEPITGAVAFLPKLVVAIVILVVAAAGASAVKELVGDVLAGVGYGSTAASAASATVVVLGVFMALNQLDIAPEIVNALFYGLVAVVAGSAIVAIGGGGVAPMRARWERALERWDDERPRLQSEIARARRDRAARREIDLREPTVETPAPPADDTPLLGADPRAGGSEPPAGSAGPTTQDRIRAEIRSDPTLP